MLPVLALPLLLLQLLSCARIAAARDVAVVRYGPRPEGLRVALNVTAQQLMGDDTSMVLSVANVSPGNAAVFDLALDVTTEGVESNRSIASVAVFAEYALSTSDAIPASILMLGVGKEEPIFVPPLRTFAPNVSLAAADDLNGFLCRRAYQFVAHEVLTPVAVNGSDVPIRITLVAKNEALPNSRRLPLSFVMRFSARALYGASSDNAPADANNTGSALSLCPTGIALYETVASNSSASRIELPEPCSGRGSCERGTCKCDSNWGGFACEAFISRLPTFVYDNRAGVEPAPLRVNVPPNEYRYWGTVVPRDGSMAVQMQIDWSSGDSLLRPVLIMKRPREAGFRWPASQWSGEALPCAADENFTDVVSIQQRNTYQTVTREKLTAGDQIVLGIYNDASGVISSPSSIIATILILPCGQDSEVICPSASAGINVGLFVVALLSGATMITIAVLCAIIMVRRRRRAQGSQPAPLAKMTQAQLEQAFPKYVYSRSLAEPAQQDEAESAPVVVVVSSDHDVHEGAGASESFAPARRDGEQCCICLCDFEDGDEMRRLRCDHQFHASCLDPWVTLKHTCPTCREPARVESTASAVSELGNSVMRSLHSRRPRLNFWPFNLRRASRSTSADGAQGEQGSDRVELPDTAARPQGSASPSAARPAVADL